MVKIGIEEQKSVIWFEPKHFPLMFKVAYVLKNHNRKFKFVFKEQPDGK